MLFHSFLELLLQLKLLSPEFIALEAQESCGRIWQFRLFGNLTPLAAVADYTTRFFSPASLIVMVTLSTMWSLSRNFSIYHFIVVLSSIVSFTGETVKFTVWYNIKCFVSTIIKSQQFRIIYTIYYGKFICYRNEKLSQSLYPNL